VKLLYVPGGARSRRCTRSDHTAGLVAEIRTGDTWRNLADQLDRIKVVEYDHNGVRVRQTSEIDRELTVLLAKLGVPPPPKLHAVAAAPPAAQ
jgi:hypothetical protein